MGKSLSLTFWVVAYGSTVAWISPSPQPLVPVLRVVPLKYVSRLPIYRVRISSWISSWIFDLDFRLGFSSWIFELNFRVRIFWRDFSAG